MKCISFLDVITSGKINHQAIGLVSRFGQIQKYIPIFPMECIIRKNTFGAKHAKNSAAKHACNHFSKLTFSGNNKGHVSLCLLSVHARLKFFVVCLFNFTFFVVWWIDIVWGKRIKRRCRKKELYYLNMFYYTSQVSR